MRRAVSRAALVLLAALLALAGCTTLPDSGEVHLRTGEGSPSELDAPYFAPPGPAEGATREAIVKGFLLAMQANPLSTAVARTFLSTDAQQAWKPNIGTLIYEASTVEENASGVLVRLSDAHRLDGRGGWVGGLGTHTDTVRLSLVREKGQWRVDNPPNALIVSASYFQNRFAEFNLYFFDPTTRVLVPDPVYIPRGEQTATTLVRGLLNGPGRRLAQVTRTAFPIHTDLDLSVVVTGSGVAEIPLSAEVLRLTAAQLSHAMVQLAWTLKQVPGITRVRITVAGSPVPLADGRTDLSVDEGAEFSPNGLGTSRELLAIRGGRVVSVAGDKAEPVAGPLGRRGFALRSLALSRTGDTVAAVTANGEKVFTAAKGSNEEKVGTVFARGHDLLRPAYDLFGALWLVDRTPQGIRVHVVSAGHDRTVSFPGLERLPITAFSISPDGTRIAATVSAGTRPRVLVANILRDANGRVLGGGTTYDVPVAAAEPALDLGPAVDVGWRSATTLAVLTRPGKNLSQLVLAMADGSPGGQEDTTADALTAVGRTTAVSGDPQLRVVVLDASGRLYRLDGAGQWARSALTKVVAVAYAD